MYINTPDNDLMKGVETCGRFVTNQQSRQNLTLADKHGV